MTKTTKTTETLARECADEAWVQMLSSYHVEGRGGETHTVGGPDDSRPLRPWEPMGGDWDALDDCLGHEADREEQCTFARAYRARLRDLIG
jgi:hypothetical protein